MNGGGHLDAVESERGVVGEALEQRPHGGVHHAEVDLESRYILGGWGGGWGNKMGDGVKGWSGGMKGRWGDEGEIGATLKIPKTTRKPFENQNSFQKSPQNALKITPKTPINHLKNPQKTPLITQKSLQKHPKITPKKPP